MSPRLPIKHSPYARFRQPHLAGNVALPRARGEGFSNTAHGILVENRLRVTRAIHRLGRAPLGNFISHVVLVRAKKQMIGVYALAYIAVMKDVQSLRYWAAHERPCDSMRFPIPAIAAGKGSVAFVVPIGRPNPASIRLFNLRPKPFFFRAVCGSHTSIVSLSSYGGVG